MSVPDWVKGHAAECERSTHPNSAHPCDCGHAALRVHAFPRPQGEGVEVWGWDGVPKICQNFHPEDVPPEDFKALLTFSEGAPAMRWSDGLVPHVRDLDRPEDAPIREAWERLCGPEPVDEDGSQPHLDGLYLFVAAENYDMEGNDWSSHPQLLPIEDVTEEWNRAAAAIGYGPTLFDDMLNDRPGHSLRFTSGDKEWWYAK